MVAVEPYYCHQCGAELGEREIDGRERKACPDCGHLHFRNAVPSVDVVVRDGETVLLIRPPSGGAWELPGGHPEFDEEPAAAAARELIMITLTLYRRSPLPSTATGGRRRE